MPIAPNKKRGPATEAAGQAGSMTLCNKQKDAVFPAASLHPGQG